MHVLIKMVLFHNLCFKVHLKYATIYDIVELV
jgi:hypothetical protein